VVNKIRIKIRLVHQNVFPLYALMHFIRAFLRHV